MSGLSNYPAGVGPNHPYFNPPDVEPCRTKDCNGEALPGDDCPVCGEHIWDDDDCREFAEDQAVDLYMERGY